MKESESFIFDPELIDEDSKVLGVRFKKKIPLDTIQRCRSILQVIYDKDQTEGSVLVTFDPTTENFGVEIPEQENTAAHTSIEDTAFLKVYDSGKVLAGIFHSHPFSSSAFLSGEDHGSAANVRYVPIGSFNFNTSALPAGTDESKLYSFGEIKTVFHNVPLLETDLAEVPEIVEVAKADREEILGLLQGKIKERRSYFGLPTASPLSKRKSLRRSYHTTPHWDADDWHDYRDYEVLPGFSPKSPTTHTSRQELPTWGTVEKDDEDGICPELSLSGLQEYRTIVEAIKKKKPSMEEIDYVKLVLTYTGESEEYVNKIVDAFWKDAEPDAKNGIIDDVVSLREAFIADLEDIETYIQTPGATDSALAVKGFPNLEEKLTDLIFFMNLKPSEMPLNPIDAQAYYFTEVYLEENK